MSCLLSAIGYLRSHTHSVANYHGPRVESAICLRLIYSPALISKNGASLITVDSTDA